LRYNAADTLEPNFGTRVPIIILLLSQCSFHNRDNYVHLKDPSGVIEATIHRHILDQYPRQIVPGAVLVLRKVALYTPNPSSRYMVITAENVVHVFDASLPVPDEYLQLHERQRALPPMAIYAPKSERSRGLQSTSIFSKRKAASTPSKIARPLTAHTPMRDSNSPYRSRGRGRGRGDSEDRLDARGRGRGRGESPTTPNRPAPSPQAPARHVPTPPQQPDPARPWRNMPLLTAQHQHSQSQSQSQSQPQPPTAPRTPVREPSLPRHQPMLSHTPTKPPPLPTTPLQSRTMPTAAASLAPTVPFEDDDELDSMFAGLDEQFLLQHR
jgi:hypothetical protein